MARPLGTEFPGAIYHVASGGNARPPISLDDTDREFLLELVSSVVTKLR